MASNCASSKYASQQSPLQKGEEASRNSNSTAQTLARCHQHSGMGSEATDQALEGVGAGRGGDAAAGADVHDVLHAARRHQALQLHLGVGVLGEVEGEAASGDVDGVHVSLGVAAERRRLGRQEALDLVQHRLDELVALVDLHTAQFEDAPMFLASFVFMRSLCLCAVSSMRLTNAASQVQVSASEGTATIWRVG